MLADDFDLEGIFFFLKFFFFKWGKCLAMSLSPHRPASTFTHEPRLHFKDEKLRPWRTTRERENWGGGKPQGADEEQSGRGAQFYQKQLGISQSQWRSTSAGVFLPNTRKGEWKARRASAYESCGNKYKSVSPAIKDMWVSPQPTSPHRDYVCGVCVCVRAK